MISHNKPSRKDSWDPNFLKHEVLDHGFIRLIDYCGDDLTTVNSARISFNKETEFLGYTKFKEELKELENSGVPIPANRQAYNDYYTSPDCSGGGVLSFDDWKLIHYLANHNHTSPFRHIYATFHVKAPEFVMRQWYKHVVGIGYSEIPVNDHGWNEISMRYIDMREGSFYCPNEFRKQSENNKQASTGEIINPVIEHHSAEDDYTLTAASCVANHVQDSIELYEQLVNSGIAKEQARMILPLNIYTEVYWTASLHAIANFIKLRDHEGAQYEIVLYARALRELVNNIAPISLTALLNVK